MKCTSGKLTNWVIKRTGTPANVHIIPDFGTPPHFFVDGIAVGWLWLVMMSEKDDELKRILVEFEL